MLGLALFSFAVGALLFFFAFSPKLSFFLDEGWKFREKTQPSELYVGANLVGRAIAGLVAIVVGVGACGQHFDDRSAAATSDGADAAHLRCQTELLPRFNETIKWNGGIVANPDEVRTLAEELGVDVVIERETSWKTHQPVETVGVNDPKKPRQDKRAFTYFGEYRSVGVGMPDECYPYIPEVR